MMEPNNDQANGKDDLKTLPLPEVEKKLKSSPGVSVRRRHKSDWPIMDPMRLRKRPSIRF